MSKESGAEIETIRAQPDASFGMGLAGPLAGLHMHRTAVFAAGLGKDREAERLARRQRKKLSAALAVSSSGPLRKKRRRTVGAGAGLGRPRAKGATSPGRRKRKPGIKGGAAGASAMPALKMGRGSGGQAGGVDEVVDINSEEEEEDTSEEDISGSSTDESGRGGGLLGGGASTESDSDDSSVIGFGAGAMSTDTMRRAAERRAARDAVGGGAAGAGGQEEEDDRRKRKRLLKRSRQDLEDDDLAWLEAQRLRQERKAKRREARAERRRRRHAPGAVSLDRLRRRQRVMAAVRKARRAQAIAAAATGARGGGKEEQLAMEEDEEDEALTKALGAPSYQTLVLPVLETLGLTQDVLAALGDGVPQCNALDRLGWVCRPEGDARRRSNASGGDSGPGSGQTPMAVDDPSDQKPSSTEAAGTTDGSGSPLADFDAGKAEPPLCLGDPRAVELFPVNDLLARPKERLRRMRKFDGYDVSAAASARRAVAEALARALSMSQEDPRVKEAEAKQAAAARGEGSDGEDGGGGGSAHSSSSAGGKRLSRRLADKRESLSMETLDGASGSPLRSADGRGWSANQVPPTADLAWLCERCDRLLAEGLPGTVSDRCAEVGRLLEMELYEACCEQSAARTGVDEPRGHAPAWEFSDTYTARERALDNQRYSVAAEQVRAVDRWGDSGGAL